jgi:hypothetical protein
MTVLQITARPWSSAAVPRRPARPVALPLPWADGRPAGARDWPLRSYREYGARPESAHQARKHAAAVLRRWRMPALRDIVVLLVSELTTNAIQASAAGPARPPGTGAAAAPPVIRLWLLADRARVMIQVWDGDRRTPVLRAVDHGAQTGRGLLIVETFSAEWGCYTVAGLDGKLVWAVCGQ